MLVTCLRIVVVSVALCAAFLPAQAGEAARLTPLDPVHMAASTQRIHVFFTGRVQGVGFRQTVKDLATEIGLRGWVRNLDDGRVEMLAEGPEADLKLLLGRLREQFHIERMEVKEERGGQALAGFEVKP